jgi:hypothetical protein
MRKITTAALVSLAVGLWAIGAAAQGRGVGRPQGAGPGGGFGSHAPLGTPGADAGNGHASTHEPAGSPSAQAGKKTPDELLTQNTRLAGNLETLLNKMNVKAPDGTALTPQEACANFKNLGQCVAAIHVSNNLGIGFNELACDMTLKPVATSTCPAGTATGTKGMSLGASIDALKPGTDGKAEAQKAVTQANADVKESRS